MTWVWCCAILSNETNETVNTLNVDCRMACQCQIVCAAADFVCTQSCYIRQRGRWCSAEGNFRLQPRNREFLQIRRYEQQSTNQEQKRHLRRIHRFGSWRRKLKINFFFCFFSSRSSNIATPHTNVILFVASTTLQAHWSDSTSCLTLSNAHAFIIYLRSSHLLGDPENHRQKATSWQHYWFIFIRLDEHDCGSNE